MGVRGASGGGGGGGGFTYGGLTATGAFRGVPDTPLYVLPGIPPESRGSLTDNLARGIEPTTYRGREYLQIFAGPSGRELRAMMTRDDAERLAGQLDRLPASTRTVGRTTTRDRAALRVVVNRMMDQPIWVGREEAGMIRRGLERLPGRGTGAPVARKRSK